MRYLCSLNQFQAQALIIEFKSEDGAGWSPCTDHQVVEHVCDGRWSKSMREVLSDSAYFQYNQDM